MKVVDMHCDTIAEIYKDHKKGGRQSILENQMMLDLKKRQGITGCRILPCMSIWNRPREGPLNSVWNFSIPSTRKWKPMRIS